MRNRGNALLSLLLIIAVLAAFVYIVYLIITAYMGIFDLLFGNGWLLFVVLILGLATSQINIPLYRTREADIVHVNFGGCILPLILTSYLLYRFMFSFNLIVFSFALLIMVIICRMFSRYVRGGRVSGRITIFVISAYILTQLLPLTINTNGFDILAQKLAFGYIIATLGTIIGVDLLHIYLIGRDGVWQSKTSIGGAGPLDGIWVTGFATMFLILLLHLLLG